VRRSFAGLPVPFRPAGRCFLSVATATADSAIAAPVAGIRRAVYSVAKPTAAIRKVLKGAEITVTGNAHIAAGARA